MKPLDPKPDLKSEALERLRGAILEGELPSGAPLAQAALAERLGVSRQPVGLALEALRREGLVVDRGRRGVAVAPLEPDRLLDLYQVRGVLDGLAAELAARRAAAQPADLGRLREVLEQGEATRSAALRPLIEADLAFHEAVYGLSGNPEIGRAAERIWPHMRRAMAAVLRGGRPRASVWEEHRAIFESIEAGDAGEAGALARAHCERAGRETAERLAQAG